MRWAEILLPARTSSVLLKPLSESPIWKSCWSAIARDWLGDGFVDHFAATRDWEWRQWLDAVTDWEMKRYFEII